MPRCLVVTHPYALNEPVRRTATSLAREGFTVTLLQGPPHAGVRSTCQSDFAESEWRGPRLPAAAGPLRSIASWLGFRASVRSAVAEVRPALVVAFMHHALAAVPPPRAFVLAACIYDIPSIPDAGRLDRLIVHRGWRRLPEASVIWASDKYKAALAREFAGLGHEPFVCHNCPALGWIPDQGIVRDPWLRTELRRQGASLGQRGGCIVLRAGAVGPCGGLEETLAALTALPEDCVFLMMGRPAVEYAASVRKAIHELGLSRRAFLWESPSDEIWKRSLLGADVGHLIHGPFPPGAARRLYELNSSLSNNRLYQYLAAGLPIVTYDDPRLGSVVRETGCFTTVRIQYLATDIAEALRALQGDAGLRIRMGDAARRAHESRYNWEAQFSGILAAISAAVSR